MKRFPDPVTIMEVHVPEIEEEKLDEPTEEEEDSAIKTITDWSIYILALNTNWAIIDINAFTNMLLLVVI